MDVLYNKEIKFLLEKAVLERDATVAVIDTAGGCKIKDSLFIFDLNVIEHVRNKSVFVHMTLILMRMKIM